MATKEQSVTLLRKNKRRQVEELNALGFTGVSESTRASEFADYIKWAGGLLDVTVAANRISDNSKWYFTIEEWESLSSENKSRFVKRGVRVRAMCESFVVATESPGSFVWAGTKKDVSTIPNYPADYATVGVYDDNKAYTYTKNIEDFFADLSLNSPAATAALAYRAFTYELDGLDDDSKWALPCVKHMLIMYRYFAEINDVIRRAWSTDFCLREEIIWTCLESNVDQAWYFSLSDGTSYSAQKTTSYAIRPICVEL